VRLARFFKLGGSGVRPENPQPPEELAARMRFISGNE
jgi:hypothetical protein